MLAREKDLSAFALVGYSVDGNLALKLAGDLGEHVPAYLKAVVGIFDGDGPGRLGRCAAQHLEPGV